MRKIAINTQFGGFSISEEAVQELAKRGKNTNDLCLDIKRDDPDLIAVIEKLGSAANGTYAKIKIVEIPDDVDWNIDEYDGNEWVSEKHRTWS